MIRAAICEDDKFFIKYVYAKIKKFLMDFKKNIFWIALCTAGIC